MGFGGMLASAVAGGAQQLGTIARGDVESQQRAELMRIQSEIEEARQQRLAEFQSQVRQREDTAKREGDFAFRTRDDVVTRNREVLAGDEAARAKIKRDSELAELNDTDLQKGRRDKMTADERAKAEAVRQRVKDDAADKGFLEAATKVEMADPKVAAQIAQMRAAANRDNASAAASAAHAGVYRAQEAGVRLDVQDKKRLSDIYAEMDKTLADAKLTPEQRADKLARLGQRASLITGAGGKGGDKPDQVETRETAEYDEQGKPIGKKVETIRKGVDRGQPVQQQSAPSGPWDKFKGGKGDAPASSPTAAAPAPAQSGPGLLKSLSGVVGDVLPSGSQQGQQIEALRAKVRSGAKLTPEETQMARRYGMGV